MGPWVAVILAISLLDSGHAASVKQFTTDDCSGTASISKDLGWFGDGKHIDINETTKAINTDRFSDIWYAFEDTIACHEGDTVDEASALGTLKNGCHDVDTFISGRRINCVRLDSNAMT
ncbi:hypothetical protein VP1G_03137 [Cytospora mali]|uniref:Ecp2 effector protein domain-containing protein n=1 Tax=Cytospora mali TaxID=578113 RepID=A0A194UVY7_CYTMA|nr:hypothetical protein VP1G_03137 [Valsa mali var. pyri (nom. inval.)]